MSGRNEERDELIMRLRERGYSLAMIARQIPNGTRSVVSGVIFRARTAGDRRADTKRPTVAVERVAPVTIARRPRVKPAIPIPPETPGSHLVLFLDIRRSGQCRLPMWRDDTPFSEKFYCGNATGEGEVYCPACRKIVYGPGTVAEQAAVRDARKAA